MTNIESLNLKNSFISIITSRILSGSLKPGDKLPPERQLAQQIGISRGSINQGILDLERMGFLHIVPRKGTYVADYMRNATPETLSVIMSYDSELISAGLFRDLMELRILIERECARLACGRMDKASLELLSRRSADIYSAEGTKLIDALYNFHKTIVQLSGNSAYLMIFQSFEKVLRNLISAHYHNAEQLEKCLPIYEKLASAISRSDAAAADMYIVEILSIALDYLNLLLAQKERSER